MNEVTEEREAKQENGEPSQPPEENRGHRRDRNRRSKPKHNRPAPQHQTESGLNLAELRELAELINEQGFTDFEFENEKIRVRLRRELAPQMIQTPSGGSLPTAQQFAPPMLIAPQQAPAQAAAHAAPGEQTGLPSAQTQPAASEEDNLHKITSPIVGTFYRAPSPEADSFVKIGSQVTPDTIVCIVEAMKLMNEIQAETTGEIVKIYVENGQPIEYGQPLFGVKK